MLELLDRQKKLTANQWKVIAAATVFAGTLAPLISDALGLGTLSVGAPYFNPTFLLSMVPLTALLGMGVQANWKRGRLGDTKGLLLAEPGKSPVGDSAHDLHCCR